MALIDDIKNDLKDAMLNKQKINVSTLRLLVSAIKNREIDQGKELDDEQIISVISTEVKKRNEAIKEFKRGNREDLAEKEASEAIILKKYLPEQLSDEELKKMVKEAVIEAAATEIRDLGKVMQIVIPKAKGRADGRKINEIAKSILEGE